MNLNEVTQACIDRVLVYDHVTFAELGGYLEGLGIPSRGDNAFELTRCPNLLLWAGMSDEFFDVAAALYDHQHIEMRPTHMLTYLADGGFLNLPVAQRPPKNGYRRPHWAPTVFCWAGPRDRIAAARRGLRELTPAAGASQ